MHKSALPHIATDVSTRDIGIHCGVDRLKFWLDQDIRTKDLQADGDSTRAESISARMPMNPLWLRIPLMADSDSISIADSVPGDGGHVARVS